MTVQIFQDSADQCFRVVGSPDNTRPDQVAEQIRSRCRPFTVKLVFIAPCKDPDRWLSALRSINTFLKPELELMATSQPGAVFSKNLADLSDPASAARLQMRMNEYTNQMQLMSNVLRMLEDANKAIIGNVR